MCMGVFVKYPFFSILTVNFASSWKKPKTNNQQQQQISNKRFEKPYLMVDRQTCREQCEIHTLTYGFRCNNSCRVYAFMYETFFFTFYCIFFVCSCANDQNESAGYSRNRVLRRNSCLRVGFCIFISLRLCLFMHVYRRLKPECAMTTFFLSAKL